MELDTGKVFANNPPRFREFGKGSNSDHKEMKEENLPKPQGQYNKADFLKINASLVNLYRSKQNLRYFEVP